MPLFLSKEDITTLAVDAIVNAANQELKNYATRRGGGVCGAIFRAAGHAQMQAACDGIGGCATGSAVVTAGFALPAKYVIHAVGPRYRQGDVQQAALLKSCYTASLNIALQMGLGSIAFPLISSGIYGYPREEALQIALDAIVDWLHENGDKTAVYLCLMDEEAYSQALRRLDSRKCPNGE